MSHAVPSPRISTTDNKQPNNWQRPTASPEPFVSYMKLTFMRVIVIVWMPLPGSCPSLYSLALPPTLPLRAYPLLGQTITFMQHSMLDCYVFFFSYLPLSLSLSLWFSYFQFGYMHEALFILFTIAADGLPESCGHCWLCSLLLQFFQFMARFMQWTWQMAALSHSLPHWLCSPMRQFAFFYFIDNFLQVFIITNRAVDSATNAKYRIGILDKLLHNYVEYTDMCMWLRGYIG